MAGINDAAFSNIAQKLAVQADVFQGALHILLAVVGKNIVHTLLGALVI